MLKVWLLRLHRWVTLVLAIPLATLIVTGLILSVEPIVIDSAVRPGSITVDTLTGRASQTRSRLQGAHADAAILCRHRLDRRRAARRRLVHVDLVSGGRIEFAGRAGLAVSIARAALHEHLIAGFGWLVTASTIALLALIMIGVLMGWPQLRNTLSGWHKGTGWMLLPLLILSPLTGLCIAFGISLAPPLPQPAAGAPIAMADAVKIVGASHDLSGLTWIRSRGNTLLARLDDGGEMKVFAVTRDGLLPTARNWPRLLHEGNFASLWPALINLLISLALLLLISTGLWIWARRKLRRRALA